MILQILKVIAAVGTVGTGVVSLLKPSTVTSFTGIRAEGPRGVTEVRAIFGGLLIAMGAFPLIAGAAVTYRMLGALYLTIAVVRAVSMVVDRSIERSNWISLAAEVALGTVLIL
ncbi:MAG: DUF4345 family protein [Anaerolineae bacterium]